jgi:hypothetical protein
LLVYEQQYQSTEEFFVNSHLPPAQLRSEQLKNFSNRTNQMTTLESNLESDRKARKKEHDDKIASCITTYNSAFNSSYLRDYTDDIQNHKFHNTWVKICKSN